MNRTALIVSVCLAVLPLRAAAQVSAEPWFRAGTWMMTVEVGGAAFSDFERSQARPVASELELGDFSRRVSARTAVSLGGWISYWIGNGWGLRAGASWVPSSFTVWHDETARRVLDAGGLLGEEEPSYRSLDVLMADASLVFRFPHSFGRVVPYGIAGAGLVRYRPSGADPIPPEAREDFQAQGRQTAAAMFGIGAAIPLQRNNLLMTFQLTNHLSRTPLGDHAAGETFELGGVLMQIQPDGELRGDDDVGLTSHVRLALGLTLPLR